MISIYTFTMGRWDYLGKCLESTSGYSDSGLEHHICSQGVRVTPKLKSYYECQGRYVFHEWPENIGIAAGMNKILPELKGDTIIKMDEDAAFISAFPLTFIDEVRRLKPNLVFSPYPVGLINNPGGPRGYKHEVIFSEALNTYFTLRYVIHVGGFCRVSPGFTKDWRFSPDLGIPGSSGNEDVQFSQRCQREGIEMAYLENGIVVEHQESTLGQHERYKEYFKGRF